MNYKHLNLCSDCSVQIVPELLQLQLKIFIFVSQQNIIRDSKFIIGEMAHQLYVYQTLVFSVLGDMVNTRGNASPQVSGRVYSTCARASLYVATHSRVRHRLASLTIIGELART